MVARHIVPEASSPYRENAMPENDDTTKRLERLERGQKDAAGELATGRTAIRSICFALVVALGVGYACNKNDNDAKVAAAKYGVMVPAK